MEERYSASVGKQDMMEEERHEQQIDAPEALTVLLGEFSAITDYRTLRDSLPRRLATLLKCRCVL